MKKTCFYEVLQVNRDSDPDTIKKAYRRLALLWHPDKNQTEEAKVRFQAITEAYEVLSDPNEKAWYDSHRDQILRGEDPGESRDFVDELMGYFSTSCFKNVYDDAPGHFYRVYEHVFANIGAFEADEFPNFGNSKLDDERLLAFYRHWGSFSTSREFSECDRYNLAQADSRQVKRAMEAENKKARSEARKEFSDTVRKLVEFVKKRDPRLVAYRDRKAEDDAQAKVREAAAKVEAKARKQAEREVARLEEERRWQEIEEIRKHRAAQDSQSEEEAKNTAKSCEVFECMACRKSFKSEKMFQNHEQSKKHKDAVAAIFRELGQPLPVTRPAPQLSKPEDVKQPAVSPPSPSESAAGEDARVASEIGGPEAEASASEDSEPVLKTERNKLKREQMKQMLQAGAAAKEEKKPRRRKDKTKEEDKNGGGSSSSLACIKCGEKFPSKTALFNHLRDSGHAAPK